MPPRRRVDVAVLSAADKELVQLLESSAKRAEQEISRLRITTGPGIGRDVRISQLQLAQAACYRQMGLIWQSVGSVAHAASLEAAALAAEQNLKLDTLLQHVTDNETYAMMLAAARAQAINNLEAASARMLGDSYIPLSKRVYNNEALSKRQVDKLLNEALARGASAREIAQEVRKYIDPNVKGGVSYAAMRLGRTEVNNAYHVTQATQNAEKPWVKGQKWELSGSHPRPDICNEYAEKVHMRGGEPGVFPKGDVPMKPHPQCFCYITPVTLSRADFVKAYKQGKYDAYINEQYDDGRLLLGAANMTSAEIRVRTAFNHAKVEVSGWDSMSLDDQLNYLATKMRKPRSWVETNYNGWRTKVPSPLPPQINRARPGTIRKAPTPTPLPSPVTSKLDDIVRYRDHPRVGDVFIRQGGSWNQGGSYFEVVKVTPKSVTYRNMATGFEHKVSKPIWRADIGSTYGLNPAARPLVGSRELFDINRADDLRDAINARLAAASVDVHGFTPGAERQIRRAVEQMTEHVPGSGWMLDRVVSTTAYHPDGKSYVAWCSYPGHGSTSTITTRTKIARGEWASPGASWELRRLTSSGWWPRDVQADKYSYLEVVFHHETGHLIDSALLLDQQRRQVFDAIADLWGVSRPRWGVMVADLDRNIMDMWVTQNHDIVASMVSEYGSRNSFEIIAEIWCEYMTGDPTAMERTARNIGPLIERLANESSPYAAKKAAVRRVAAQSTHPQEVAKLIGAAP